MPKLNQILAIEKQSKTAAAERLTEVYHQFQKEEPIRGLARTYKPLNDDGERFPPENKSVQVRVDAVLTQLVKALTPFYNVTAQRDYANCEARADVIIDGEVLLRNVPAPHLLWLEKQCVGLHTLISKLPTLPQDETWEYSATQSCYVTSPVETSKTKKIPKAFVKAEATEHHPAQVETFHEDVIQGYWTTVKYSGALPKDRVLALTERVEKLAHAVKFAREQANLVEAPKTSAGDLVLGWLFA